MRRPFSSWSVEKLAAHVWDNKGDLKILKTAKAELAHRRTMKAEDLRLKVDFLIKQAVSKQEAQARAQAQKEEAGVSVHYRPGRKASGAASKDDQSFMSRELSRLREKLIDISKRNKLISFKHSERGADYVRVVDELPDELFGRLTSGPMVFEALPNDDVEPRDQETAAFQIALESARITDNDYRAALERLGEGALDEEGVQDAEQALVGRVRESLGLPKIKVGKRLDIAAFARANGFDPSFRLPVAGEGDAAHFRDNAIRVLYTEDRLEKRLRTIFDRYRGHLAETGIHTLQTVFGFLEWRDHSDPAQAYHAPLLLLPSRLNREIKKNRYVYTLEAEDEVLSVNMALQEKLRREFNVELPSIEETDTPESYFIRVSEVLEDVDGLTLERFVTLSVLPFPNMAVWRDLDPSAWPEENILQHQDLMRLLGAKESGATGDAFPPDYDIEALPAKKAPTLVLPADISQHSALVETSSGASLAIEGPPGTGKSQTIANIIAQGLDSGRRVLFVAEKRAALEVVARRLEALGFAPLMLELHSDRATRSHVADSLRGRLEQRPPRRNPDPEATRNELVKTRNTLKQYRAVLQHRVGRIDKNSVNQLVWKEVSLRDRVGATAPEKVWTRKVKGAAKILQSELNDARAALDYVEQSARDVAAHAGGLENSPWAGVADIPSNPLGQRQLLDSLKRLEGALSQLLLAFAHAESLGVRTPNELESIDHWISELKRLPAPDDIEAERFSFALRDMERAEAMVRLIRTHVAALENAEQFLAAPREADPESIEAAELAVAEIEGAKSGKALGARATQLAADLDRLQRLDVALRPHLAEAAGAQPVTLEVAETFMRCLELVKGVADADLALRSVALLSDDAAAELASAHAAATALRLRRSELSSAVDLEAVAKLGHGELWSNSRMVAASGFLHRLFSSSTRLALARCRSIALNPKISATDAASLAAKAGDYCRDLSALESNARWIALAGASWQGLDTPFDRLGVTANGLGEIDTLARKARLGFLVNWFVTAPPRAIKLAAEDAEDVEAFEINPCHRGLELGSLRDALTTDLAAARHARQLIVRAGVREDADIEGRQLSEDVRKLGECAEELAALKREVKATWPTDSAGDAADLEAQVQLARKVLDISAGIRVLEALGAESNIPRKLKDLIDAVAQVTRAHTVVTADWAGLSDAYSIDPLRFFLGRDPQKTEVRAVHETVLDAISDEVGLRLYATLAQSFFDAESHGADWVFTDFLSEGATPADLADTYELALVRTLLGTVFDSDGALFTRLGGARLEGLSDRFKKLDESLAKVEAERIISERLRDSIPGGRDSGPKREWTNLPLIKNEVGKQRRHIPVRDLIARAGDAIQALKPAWLMSPTSLAQFVPPNSVDFDMVVIDEASQMTPEMAAGAIARGQQVIVVGDPKQLPPTNFFQISSALDDDDDNDGIAADSESILDLAYSRLPVKRRLKWHYRSRDPRLIQFSNREFYDNELVIPPSPAVDDDLQGVRSHYVGGIYEGRINLKEVEAVIENLVGLILTRPELSFGVATMNLDQRELIFQEFERIKSEQPAVQAYVSRLEGGPDELFIKNLENVQGDERDVILISTVYGPAKQGAAPLQRFGLLTRADGHRRLNVLVTRARMATIVFTSLRPDDIKLTETSSRGVQAFKAYLTYAAGAATVDNGDGGTPDSDFEEFVAERIRAYGYEAVPQIGVEKYRIDIGVRHPSCPVGFLAGIECDGASYHSGLSVRDRDRVRQQVLEDLGWRIYRVWSTDWFNDPDKETGRLIGWLDAIKERTQAAFAVTGDVEEAVERRHVQIELQARSEPEEEHTSEALEPVTAAADRLETEATPESVPTTGPRTPSGRRRELDGIPYYEEMPGYFEVWVDEAPIGTVERLSVATSTVRLYGGGSTGAAKPDYLVTQEWDGDTFRSQDIYEAIRALVAKHRARALQPA